MLDCSINCSLNCGSVVGEGLDPPLSRLVFRRYSVAKHDKFSTKTSKPYVEMFREGRDPPLQWRMEIVRQTTIYRTAFGLEVSGILWYSKEKAPEVTAYEFYGDCKAASFLPQL